MKVFVLLQWFYEGDSNLVNSFVGVKSTYEEAKSLLSKDDILLSIDDFCERNVEPLPKDWGGYNDVSKYEIRKIEL